MRFAGEVSPSRRPGPAPDSAHRDPFPVWSAATGSPCCPGYAEVYEKAWPELPVLCSPLRMSLAPGNPRVLPADLRTPFRRNAGKSHDRSSNKTVNQNPSPKGFLKMTLPVRLLSRRFLRTTKRRGAAFAARPLCARNHRRGPAQISAALLFVAICGAPALACSTVSATNYLKAEWRHRSFSGCPRPCIDRDSPDCTVSCARVSGQPGGEFQIYARGGTRIVAVGPCLLPVLPNDAPLLDSESILLAVRLDLRSVAPDGSVVRLITSGLEASFSDGSRLLPDGISFSVIHSGGTASFTDYASYSPDYGEELKASYEIAPHALLELPFRSRTYAGVDWVEIQPRVAVDTASGERLTVKSPRVRLVPARDYDYDPFEVPLYFGPVH